MSGSIFQYQTYDPTTDILFTRRRWIVSQIGVWMRKEERAARRTHHDLPSSDYRRAVWKTLRRIIDYYDKILEQTYTLRLYFAEIITRNFVLLLFIILLADTRGFIK